MIIIDSKQHGNSDYFSYSGNAYPCYVLTKDVSLLKDSIRILHRTYKNKVSYVSLSIVNTDNVEIGEYGYDGKFHTSFSHYPLVRFMPTYHNKMIKEGEVHKIKIHQNVNESLFKIYDRVDNLLYSDSIESIFFSKCNLLGLCLNYAKENGILEIRL